MSDRRGAVKVLVDSGATDPRLQALLRTLVAVELRGPGVTHQTGRLVRK